MGCVLFLAAFCIQLVFGAQVSGTWYGRMSVTKRQDVLLSTHDAATDRYCTVRCLEHPDCDTVNVQVTPSGVSCELLSTTTSGSEVAAPDSTHYST